MRLAGIDIGSNAVRLLIADVIGDDQGAIRHFRKVKLYRIPVRLGVDAFTQGKISPPRLDELVKAMKAYSLLMDIYQVEAVQACATSAMREATNAPEVIEAVKRNSGIEIQIIRGDKEADLILSNRLHVQKGFDDRFSHLYVDVGGGSTEISLLDQEGLNLSRSFKIGTIRLFKEQVTAAHWAKMATWLKVEIAPQLPLSIIGSGGNIFSVFKRSGNRPFQPLIYEYLRQERELLAALSLDDRIYLQDLNLDRAEVIVPALDIFLFVMEHTGIRQVMVPKMGLSDGIVRRLFLKQMKKKHS